MIQLTLNVAQIPEQIVSDVSIRIFNSYVQPCTALRFDLKFPPELTMLRGRRDHYIDGLDAGEDRTISFQVRPVRCGEFGIVVRGFSYQDPQGSYQHITDQTLTLGVVPDPIGQRQAQTFDVSLTGELVLASWCNLDISICNLTGVDHDIVWVHLLGPVKAEPYRLDRFKNGEEVKFHLPVLPLEKGDYTPVEVRIITDEKSKSFSRRVTLRVGGPKTTEETGASSSPKYVINVQNAHGFVVGDQPHVTQNFNSGAENYPDSEKRS